MNGLGRATCLGDAPDLPHPLHAVVAGQVCDEVLPGWTRAEVKPKLKSVLRSAGNAEFEVGCASSHW